MRAYDRKRWETNRIKLQEKTKLWGEKNVEKRKNTTLKATFGITLEQYNELLEKQKHRCFICQRHEKEFSRRLSVDHDHVTNEIRGLLCGTCNKFVIGSQRDPKIFEKAAEYLEGPFTGWIVPETAYARKKKKKRKHF